MNNVKKNRAFSLVELVIVVVIIGIIAAIAIPRLSRGATGAADSSLHGNLKVLRTAIDLFASEHGGVFPNATDPTNLLTGYSDEAGTYSATKVGNFIYGPYIRAVPSLPVGAKKGTTGIADVATAATTAWVYNKADGTIKAAATESDAKGIPYADY